MKLTSTLLTTSLFMLGLPVAMAAEVQPLPVANSAPVPVMQHQTSWQPLNAATPKVAATVPALNVANSAPAKVNSTQATPAVTANTTPAPLTTSNSMPVVAPTTSNSISASAATTPSINTTKISAPKDSNDSFVKTTIERNEVLSQLEYEKQVLTLQQDIAKLKDDLEKSRPKTQRNAPNFSGPLHDNNDTANSGTPALLAIFIKNNQAQATIYYRGNTINADAGKKIGPYTVKTIDKSTVTLLNSKKKPIILTIIEDNNE
jgi:type IV pilus biogenesis protein PilP